MEKSKFLKWIIAFAIVIVLNLFYNYAIDAVQKSPKYEDFCRQTQVIEVIGTKEACLSVGGQWDENGYRYGPYEDPNVITSVPIKINSDQKGFCNPNFTCEKTYQGAESLYNRNVFIVLVGLGLLAIGGSFLVASYEAVSLGLSLGGVLSFIIASIRYWSDMNEYLRVIVLGFALVALIWLGIKKIKNE